MTNTNPPTLDNKLRDILGLVPYGFNGWYKKNISDTKLTESEIDEMQIEAIKSLILEERIDELKMCRNNMCFDANLPEHRGGFYIADRIDQLNKAKEK